MTANLKRAFEETILPGDSYKQVNVLVADSRYTLVPLELFEDEQAATLFYQNHTAHDNELILYNVLRRSNIVVLFAMNKSAHNYLCELYPHVRFYAQASAFIEHFALESRQSTNRKLYAHIQKERVDLFVYDRNRLLMNNSFGCKHTSDRVYYLLYVWKTLELDQELDELHLCGPLPGQDDLLNQLRNYIRQVSIMNPSINLDFQAIATCE